MTTAENKAVNNLLKWATRAPWKDRYAETQDRIVDLASRTNGVEFEDAIDAISLKLCFLCNYGQIQAVIRGEMPRPH